MVHLSTTHDPRSDTSTPQLPVRESQAGDSDVFTTSVYGSRFAGEDLPKHKMPETQMPRDVAYRMIKDDLSLDGNPTLK
jgi:glutamate decarboxylase